MNIMREYEIKNTSIKNVKNGTTYKEIQYIYTVEKSIRSKNTGNSMQVKGSCSVVLTFINIKNNGIKLWMPAWRAYCRP